MVFRKAWQKLLLLTSPRRPSSDKFRGLKCLFAFMVGLAAGLGDQGGTSDVVLGAVGHATRC